MKKHYPFLMVILCYLCLNMGCKGKSEQYRFYIGTNGDDNNSGLGLDEPLASIEKAIDLISQKKWDDPDITFEILLKGGRYELNRSVRLSSKALQQHKIHFEALKNEKVIVSGGKVIDKEWINIGENLWSTSVKENFKQLFQGERRLVRARWPNEKYYLHPSTLDTSEKWMAFPDSVSLSFSVDGNMEMVTTGKWHFIRQRLATLDTDKNRITTQTEIGPECSSTKVGLYDRIYFENHFDFLDIENEWYLDTATNTLFLFSRTNPNDSEFHFPIIESLFLVEGTKESPINVSFKGITFEHSTWRYSDNERKGIQAGAWGTEIGKPVYLPSAAVVMKYAEDGIISNCTFQNLGEGAIALEEGCHGNIIDNNIFKDIGSNVVQIARISDFVGRDHPLHFDYLDKEIAPSNNVIKNNHFINGSSIDNGGVAIWVGYANHTKISNNLIEDFPYTGISVGWRWGNDGKLTNTHNNEISFNRIRNCMEYLSDGGAIYTVGNQPGTMIMDNWISDISGGELLIEGIYTDEGSGGMLVSNNYINNVQNYDYKAHRNLWETMVIENNGCEKCENELKVENEYVRYSDFPNNIPMDSTKYGLLK